MLCSKLDTLKVGSWIKLGIMEGIAKDTKSSHKLQVAVFYAFPYMYGARRPLHKSGPSVLLMAGRFNLFNF